MRAALLERPGPTTEATLVRRMAETARIAQQEAGDATKRAARRSVLPARRSRLRLAARLAVTVGALVLAMAGLAVAGVKLPQPARSALDDIGVHLPNQAIPVSTGQSSGEPADQAQPPADQAQSPAGKPAATGKPPAGERGKSKAAHQRVREARAHRLAQGHGRKLGYTRGKAIGLNEATPPGQTPSRGGGRHSAPAKSGGPSPNPHSESKRRGPKGTPRGHVSGKSKGPKSGAHRP